MNQAECPRLTVCAGELLDMQLRALAAERVQTALEARATSAERRLAALQGAAAWYLAIPSPWGSDKDKLRAALAASKETP